MVSELVHVPGTLDRLPRLSLGHTGKEGLGFRV